MTAAVLRGVQDGSFEDPVRMVRLDVAFASRYLQAWHAWQAGQPTTHSWQLAFEAADQPHIILQHLLLGINAHINLDLAIAAAYTAPGNSIHAMATDFNRINEVIATLADSMQNRLANLCPPMRLLGRLAAGREKAVLNFSIAKARQAAWTNAVILAELTEPDDQHIAHMDLVVAELATRIMRPGGWARWLLPLIGWREEREVEKAAAELAKSLTTN